MSQNASRERLQPSLLDRLTDQAPEQRRDSPDQQSMNPQQLRQAVLRDLAWLLNTTNLAALEDLTGVPLAAASTINFGIPGFAGVVGTANRLTALEAGIADAVRAFEPRIRGDTLVVRVRPSEETSPGSAVMFEIEGELWAQPIPQQLFVETSIDLETGLSVVTDARMRG